MVKNKKKQVSYYLDEGASLNPLDHKSPPLKCTNLGVSKNRNANTFSFIYLFIYCAIRPAQTLWPFNTNSSWERETKK